MFFIYSKYVQKFCPSGILIKPDINDLKSKVIFKNIFSYTLHWNLVWNGILIYRNESSQNFLKFELRIPNEYPSKIPKIYFNSKNRIRHTLIAENTGELDWYVLIK